MSFETIRGWWNGVYVPAELRGTLLRAWRVSIYKLEIETSDLTISLTLSNTKQGTDLGTHILTRWKWTEWLYCKLYLTCGAVATHEPANKVNMCAYVRICIFHNNTGLCKVALTVPPVKMHFSAFKKKGGIREGI